VGRLALCVESRWQRRRIEGGRRAQSRWSSPSRTARKLAISYAVPNKNQCKQCHSTKDSVMPVGPVWHNLSFADAKSRACISSSAATFVRSRDASFEAKVGRCQNPARSRHARWPICASIAATATSRPDRRRTPACSTTTTSATRPPLVSASDPVAAGRGSGNFEFVIEPGHPERSILIYRMKSTDPGHRHARTGAGNRP
jgi:hypothetical protein